MHLCASCSDSYSTSMFLQRLTSAASPASTAALSFFFHTCEPHTQSCQPRSLTWELSVCRHLLVPATLPSLRLRRHYQEKAADCTPRHNF